VRLGFSDADYPGGRRDEMATDRPAELSLNEKYAVDALLAAWARLVDQRPFAGEGHSAFARALQSMSWKIIEDIHQIATACRRASKRKSGFAGRS
jgi:hypothetical protein